MEADSELLDRIVRRDKEAFSLLYDRWAPVVFNFCVRILRDVGDAEEVLQDVFVQVWKDAHRFDPARGSAKTWLFTIARSRALDRWRSRKSVDKRVDAEVPLVEVPAAKSGSGERSLLSQLVARQMGRLPAKEKAVLSLAYFEGLTQEEIASRLDEPLGTVKGRARSGLARLHALFGGDRVDG